MWLVEIIQFPVLLNIVNTGVCNFESDKLIIQEVQCYSDNNMFSDWLTAQEQRTIGWCLALVAGLIVLAYNIGLVSHLYGESVSIAMHENYIVKKEVEFCMDLTTNWCTRNFFFLSSFRGGI